MERGVLKLGDDWQTVISKASDAWTKGENAREEYQCLWKVLCGRLGDMHPRKDPVQIVYACVLQMLDICR